MATDHVKVAAALDASTQAMVGELEGRGAVRERVACAELVRAAGCVCKSLRDSRHSVKPLPGKAQCWIGRPETCAIDLHDPRCPLALSDAIERRG
jgi:hypothetical protein